MSKYYAVEYYAGRQYADRARLPDRYIAFASAAERDAFVAAQSPRLICNRLAGERDAVSDCVVQHQIDRLESLQEDVYALDERFGLCATDINPVDRFRYHVLKRILQRVATSLECIMEASR